MYNKSHYFILLIIFIIGFFQLNSQTINPDWFLQNGHETNSIYAGNSQSFPTPEEGIDIIWDFTESTNGGSDKHLIYVDPQLFNWIDSFPSATSGAVDADKSFYNEFYEENESNLLYWGRATKTNSGIDFLTIYSDPLIVMESPLVFGSSFEDAYIYRSYLDGAYINIQEGVQKTSFAGTGTVITPSGIFNNCIMLKIEDEGLGGTTPFVSYRFFKNNLSNMIASHLEQGVTSTGEIQKIVWYQIENLTLKTTEDQFDLDTKLIVLDNGQLQFNSTEEFKGNFSIYTSDGKLLTNKSVHFSEGSNTISINKDVTGLVYGILTDTKTQRFKSFKIIF